MGSAIPGQESPPAKVANCLHVSGGFDLAAELGLSSGRLRRVGAVSMLVLPEG